jgi:hypothetical protein
MRKSITICAVTGICSVVALSSTDTTAFAQAGSTGGTIGKTDKSASGGKSGSRNRSTDPGHAKRPLARRVTDVVTSLEIGIGNSPGVVALPRSSLMVL